MEDAGEKKMIKKKEKKRNNSSGGRKPRQDIEKKIGIRIRKEVKTTRWLKRSLENKIKCHKILNASQKTKTRGEENERHNCDEMEPVTEVEIMHSPYFKSSWQMI